ncbi:MAG: hypothetical protein IAA81_04710, partial [Spirochaetes bacterium]|nr:hypothetical protein [Candidatus Gallitreponema excrementavium]
EVLARGTCKKKNSLMPTQSSVPQPKANYPRIRHSRITICVFAGKNAVYLANQSCKDGKSKDLCHKYTASYPRIRLVPDSEVLAHGTCKKKNFLMPTQSSVPRKINFHQIPGSLSPIFHIFKNKKLKGLIFGVNL